MPSLTEFNVNPNGSISLLLQEQNLIGSLSPFFTIFFDQTCQ